MMRNTKKIFISFVTINEFLSLYFLHNIGKKKSKDQYKYITRYFKILKSF